LSLLCLFCLIYLFLIVWFTYHVLIFVNITIKAASIVEPLGFSGHMDSNMIQYINYVELWSKNNITKINFKKTKEIILDSIQKILHHRSMLVEM